MIREFFSEIEQNKTFVMFFTTVIYIAGLFGFFCDKAVETAFVLTVLAIIALFKNYFSFRVIIFWYLVFFFAFFNVSCRIKSSDDLSAFAPAKAEITGQIVSIPDTTIKNKERFFFKANKIILDDKSYDIKAKTYVTVYNNDETMFDFKIGMHCKFSGKLRIPFTVTNPSQFDYGKYLRNFNTYTVFYTQTEDCVSISEKLSPKWRFLQRLNDVRADIIKTHSKYLKSPNLEILGGIVFGDDAVSPPDYIKTTFINSGLLHILAASGMNVALIYGILFFILRTLKVPLKISVICGIFVVILYTLMTGMGPSIIRASIILIFVLIGKLADRDANSVSLLSFVALLMLIYNPAYINDVGFQLSFTVTFGILIMSEVIMNLFKFIPNWLSGTIFIPIIAQIWVAPVQMYYFNTYSLYSVFANILSVPFLTVISFGGFISSVLSLIKPISDVVCMCFDFVLNPFLNMIVNISSYFANLPHSLIYLPQPTILQIFFYYSALILLTWILKNGVSKKYIIAFAASILIIICAGFRFDNKFELITFDVQNADAFLLNAHGKYFIIDTGKSGYNGGKSAAEYIIMEYLKDKGIKNIEGMIITHFDSDHAGGAYDLLRQLNIKYVYVNSLNDKSEIAQKIYKNYSSKVKLVKNNTNILSNSDTDIIIYKENFPEKSENSDNNNSLITLIKEKDFKILMMGDAGAETFSYIEKNLPFDKINVLKVGHHGGKGVLDAKMLQCLKPDYAIISTGFNIYGHPNPEIIQLLKDNNVKILRTDRDNAIKVNTKEIMTFNKKSGWQKVDF